MEYKIVIEQTMESIDDIVNHHLQLGWVLYGPPIACGYQNDTIKQAMVRPPDNPTTRRAWEKYATLANLTESSK